MKRIRYRFVGLDCTSCAKVVEKKLGKRKGIRKVGASLMTDTVLIDFNPEEISQEEIEENIRKTGLRIVRANSAFRP